MTQPTQQSPASSSTLLKIFLAIPFATFLALAPIAAYAQHGGGGGSHGGAGGGGGSHGGGGGHVSTSSSAGSHAASASTGGNSANPNGGGHWWNPFHGNSANTNSEAKSGANSGA